MISSPESKIQPSFNVVFIKKEQKKRKKNSKGKNCAESVESEFTKLLRQK